MGDSIVFKICLFPKDANSFYLVNKNIINIFKQNEKNIKILSINDNIDEDCDYKISLGSLIKFYYKITITIKVYLFKNKLVNNWLKNYIKKSLTLV